MGERARQARKLRAAGAKLQVRYEEGDLATRAIATYATNEQPRKVNTNCKHSEPD